VSDDSTQIRDAIKKAIEEHDTILFMKGTPDAPACGFSARTVATLQSLDAPFAAVDVLPDPRIRQELSAISSWPTIPQLFAKGELVGTSPASSRRRSAWRLRTTRLTRSPLPSPARPLRWASRTA